MSAEPEAANPLEQLLEVLLYAPVGLIYEYQEVVPRLVQRGKSQVQLARLLGRMAANQARSSGQSSRAESNLAEVAGVAWTVLARAITEVGTTMGLAPDRPAPESAAPAAPAAPADQAPGDEAPVDVRSEPDGAEPAVAAADQGPLPIAGYDTLTAREVIALVGELSGPQRARVRSHERANRNRKTILARLDQLDPSG